MRSLGLALLAGLTLAAPAPAEEPRHLVGTMHAHSAYSDGWPGTRPADWFTTAERYGLDFFAGSDHTENMGLPIVANESCLGANLAQCAIADQVNPADSFRKWEATAEQTAAATARGKIAAIRGFEWSSDRFGHLNVYFSKNWTSAYSDGGFADLKTFWDWFTRPETLGGGADGLGTFNHPSAKSLEPLPGLNWNDFAFVPAADERMVGIEVFNDRRDHGAGHYARALDRGWHVGAVGAEDLGHNHPDEDNWGGPQWPKTVVVAPERTPEAVRAALLARRFYAVGPDEGGLRMDFTIDGEPMGARLARADGGSLSITASVTDPALQLELVTSGEQVVATGTGTLAAEREAAAGEPWYFVRALRDGRPVAYSSPIWVEDGARRGRWLAGDGHVHTCYSHDSWCPPDDDNTGPDTFYSSFATVAQRFHEAAIKGLDFLTISDHNDVRAWDDPAFGTQGVLGVHAYEASLSGGHAHAIGVSRLHDRGDGSALATNALATAINDEGGLFQANHPAEGLAAPFGGCDSTEGMSWRYGMAVRPDLVEVWNATTPLQPSELFWECWLQRGHRVPAGAGSDSHGGNQPSLGVPTLWVFAKRRTEASIIAAMRAGRTTISRRPPLGAPMRLLIEGEDGEMVGDTVEPGSRLTVRVEGLEQPGFVRVRGNGRTLLDRAPILPGGVVELDAPAEGGWVRATLLMDEGSFGELDPNCTPNPLSAESPYALCSGDLLTAAMTSPIYVGGARRPARAARRGRDGWQRFTRRQRSPHDESHAEALGAVEQSGHGKRLPRVRAVRKPGETLPRR